MSGYLEVKYPFKSNIGLNPFKSWRRQWCILRPSPTRAGGGSLAVYCSEAGAAAGCVELPPWCLVRRAKSRSRPHAFAVFADDKKPRVLFAAATAHEAQLWMDKMQALLQGDKLIGTESQVKDSYSITVRDTELSRKCGLTGDGALTLAATGLVVSQQARDHRVLVKWNHVKRATLSDDKTTCTVCVDSAFPHGFGELRLSAPLAADVVEALGRRTRAPRLGRHSPLSRSHPDLSQGKEAGAVRTRWDSDPADVSLDDTDLLMSKESGAPRRLARCGARQLAAPSHHCPSDDDNMSDRGSLLSLSSGIYEEIPERPARPASACGEDDVPVPKLSETSQTLPRQKEKYSSAPPEPTYESVPERARAAPRRAPPPPLPPRVPFGSTKLGESWNSRLNADGGVTRHASLGSLPRGGGAKTLPKEKTKQHFSVFRKRLKSDSLPNTSPKSKENADTKKKRFDFTPTKDIFRNFKVGRKTKNTKPTGNLSKIGETKSCEFLDETEHVPTTRCSKSVENLDGNSVNVDEYDDTDLSIDSNDDVVASLTLPQDILELILKNREFSIKQDLAEDDYMPMSPIVPPPEQHYIVMSPRTNTA